MSLLTHRARGTGPRATNMKVVRERPLPNGSRSGDLDLQSLARERWRGTGPRPTMRGGVFFTVARGPVPRERWSERTMARDRPSPYDEGGVFYRSAGACPPRWFKNRFFIVARGPVPRDRWGDRTLARDRPSPYEEGRLSAALLHRDREVSPTLGPRFYGTRARNRA